MIFFTVCLCIGYLTHQNIKIQRYSKVLLHDHGQLRTNFLNNTFCGKFVSGTWQETINNSDIETNNQLLQLQAQRLENDHENVSCTEFITKNGFYSKHITDLENENPMAFSILVYKNLYQFQVLMRTLYVRTNFHCIHVDADAWINIYTYALKLSACLENVYVPNTRINVEWGDITILEAERLCQRYLLNQSSKWHYHMTIAGTELPIQTNLNRLQILQLVPDKFRVDVSSYPQPYNRQWSKNISPPGNMTIYKGEFHSILTRDFIQAVLTDPFALELWSFLNDTHIPDEQFYPSLVRLSGFPGSKARVVQTYYHYDQLSHYKSWNLIEFTRDICLSGDYAGSVCQFNYKDLVKLEESGRLFANKFDQNLDFTGIDCWEQWLYIKQNHHQDIDRRNYVNKYPFTQRMANMNDSQTTISTPQLKLPVVAFTKRAINY